MIDGESGGVVAGSVRGRAGASVRRIAWKRFGVVMAAFIVLYAVLLAILKGAGHLPIWLWGVPVILVLLAMRTVMRTGEHRIDQAIQGAEAEELVGAELAKLDDRFHVIHDVVVGPGNIDHVVVGPAGIFTIETKSHWGKVAFRDGRFLRDGRPFEKNVLGQSYAEAKSLQEHLRKISGKDFPVTPLLVFTRAFVEVRGKARGVQVLPVMWMNERLGRGPASLPEAERARVARALGVLVDQARSND
jgi:hypothetical protein